VKNNLLAYQVLANVVGVLLIVLVLVGLPLNELHRLNESWFALGTDPQKVGSWISTKLGVAHGWLYMAFLFTAFALARRAKWPTSFTITTLLCGTVPILSFWSERRASRKLLEQYPDLLVEAA
jgi:integral membrane protein